MKAFGVLHKISMHVPTTPASRLGRSAVRPALLARAFAGARRCRAISRLTPLTRGGSRSKGSADALPTEFEK